MTTAVSACLFIADKKINKWMQSFDLCPPYKVFISSRQFVKFTTTTTVDDAYFMNLIKLSKEQPDFWVPAIQHNGVVHVSPEIMEISDGDHTMFIPQNVPERS